MNTDDLTQQKALQKEFNALVLNLSQQVSKKHLLDANKNIKKINNDITDNLEKHALLLTEVGKNHPKNLEDISNKYLTGLDKNLEKINGSITSKLDKHATLLEHASKAHPKALEDIVKKHLSEIDGSLGNVNTAIANQLADHATLLQETNKTHAKTLEQVSNNHLVNINTSIKQLNEDIPTTLEKQRLALQSIEKILNQHHNDICSVMKNELTNLSTINKRLLLSEGEKLKQKLETSFKINNSEISELKKNNYKLSNELNRTLDAKINHITRTVLYATITIIICIGLPLAFIIYTITVS